MESHCLKVKIHYKSQNAFFFILILPNECNKNVKPERWLGSNWVNGVDNDNLSPIIVLNFVSTCYPKQKF